MKNGPYHSFKGKAELRIGIVGGAGAMAGALLFEKLIEVAQNKYHAARDIDFPYILLLNYPFSDMLKETYDRTLIERELQECFDCFRNCNISLVAIACNTLHNFLPPDLKGLQLIHMIEETALVVKQNKWDNPLILCSSTAAKSKLHAGYFSCCYPSSSLQKELDLLIDKITLGDSLHHCSDHLNSFLKDEPTVLGCTELSLLHKNAPLRIQKIADPNTIVAERLAEIIYQSSPRLHLHKKMPLHVS